ncbi:MAG TPA: hypothetical protein VGC76_14455 [Pyrinomonadaceae bacterium]|jgi:hypothetical protein
MPTVIDENIRKQAFWLYGVIVGLAVKEALTHVLPHIFKEQINLLERHIPEMIRLFVFLVLCVRFYLGAAQYFDEAYEKKHPATVIPFDPPAENIGTAQVNEAPPVLENKYKKKSFGLDFLVGFFHFLIFSALALSICYDESGWNNEISIYLFPSVLLTILLYDVVWLLVNIKKHTFALIKLWTFLNVVTVVVCAATFGAVWVVYHMKEAKFQYFVAEAIAFIPLLLLSALDIAELIAGTSIIRRMLSWIAGNLGSLASSRQGDATTDAT